MEQPTNSQQEWREEQRTRLQTHLKDFYTDRCRYDQQPGSWESTMEIYDTYADKLLAEQESLVSQVISEIPDDACSTGCEGECLLGLQAELTAKYLGGHNDR